MKIGVMTFHRALNYGALLQAYALQETIKSFGNEVEIVDYRNDIIENAYYFPKLSERRDIKSILKYLLQGQSEKKRRRNFERFRNEMLNLSNRQYNLNTIEEINNRYDKIVVGSDQVWNYQAHGFDENFFLKFLHDSKKKASFAASVGLEKLPDPIIADKYIELLHDFPICSVREKQGYVMLNEMGLATRLDVDPSFLLTKNEWVTKLNIKNNKEKYIFAYYFELTPTLKKFVEELSVETGYPVKYLGCTIKSPFRCKSNSLKTGGPIEFVECIYNAEYVVTNSFHGTAFSINFNKKFFVELLKTDKKVNSRLINILDATNLEHRQLSYFKNMKDAVNQEIKWKDSCNYISKMRDSAKQYIKEGFNGTNS